ncbi:glutaredoxin family protein [Bacillus sp. FJAT-42376]|nr:glutaredoxin family protein [Bacillus sp. FJAT-42376]
MNLTVYSREGCHLCEEAVNIIAELCEEMDGSYTIVDIQKDDGLTEKYGLMIPVIEMDGKTLVYGQVKKDFLSKRIHEDVRIE